METPMNLMKISISAIEVHNLQSKNKSNQYGNTKSECRYVLLDGSYFQYNRAKGKVSKVIKLN